MVLRDGQDGEADVAKVNLVADAKCSGVQCRSFCSGGAARTRPAEVVQDRADYPSGTGLVKGYGSDLSPPGQPYSCSSGV